MRYAVIPVTRTVFGIDCPSFMVVDTVTGEEMCDHQLSPRDAEVLAWAMNKEIN